jgi:hypothetical protein
MGERIPDFIVLREDWNVYRLRNSTIIKSKNSLAVFQFPQQGAGGQFEGGQVKLAPSHVVIPAKEDLGPASNDVTIGPEDIVGTVTFETIQYPVNVYDFPREAALVLTRLHLLRVTKTRKFDKDGIRIYQLNLGMSLGPTPYPPEPPQVAGSSQQKDASTATS